MARRNAEIVEPDAGDFDEPAKSSANDAGTNNGFESPENIGAGNDYARDDNGNVIRNKDGSPRKRRGRKRGSNSGKGNATNNQAINTLSQTLYILHMGIANITKFDDFKLNEKEAETLASATANVADAFDFQPDPRFQAVAGLVSVSAMIYGPRIYLYRKHLAEKDKEKSNEDANGVDNVFIAPFKSEQKAN